MKTFVIPEIEDMSEIMLEPVYAASGTTPTPKEEETPKGDWTVRAEYRNHNSGSHSEVAIIGHNNGCKSGEVLVMYFSVVCGYEIDYIKDCGGMQVDVTSPTTLKITRVNHFNGGENVEFNIQIVVKNSPYKGAAGVTGESYPEPFVCDKYVAS